MTSQIASRDLTDLLQAVRSVPIEGNAPVFSAPWEAQAFAMVLSLHERKLFTWQEWADALAGAIREAQLSGDPDTGATYYSHWLAALEAIVASKALLSREALSRRKEEWRDAAERTPHGQPIILGCSHH